VDVIERFGRFNRIVGPGLHPVYACLGEAVAGRLSTAQQHQEVQCEVKTRDGVFVELVVRRAGRCVCVCVWWGGGGG
jgi:regulator of protease activity HflC (stomatin/prohibitin superfamily)